VVRLDVALAEGRLGPQLRALWVHTSGAGACVTKRESRMCRHEGQSQRKHGQYFRWDLMRGLPTLYSQADSKRAEEDLAQRLSEQGYAVESGH
jgi:hypothetical protein